MEYISGRYEILDNNDKIVCGKLYKARDLENDALVYIQLLKDNKYISKSFLPNLIDESTMLNEINSYNIAKILDLGIHLSHEERYFYVVNEYFCGIELKKIIKGNYMDLNSIVTITKKILKTLDTGYRQGLYHGSLSEENIFVDENYNIKIYDYCITKANKGVNVRKDNCIAFLSPHQLNINYTDKESDFFTLGIILFDAIFKKMPFGIGKDEAEMLKLIDKGIDWNTVGINNENIALVNIVKMLTRRTEKYNGINEILIDLSNFMYVKADIEEIDEFDEEIDTQINKIDNFVEQVLYYSRSDEVGKDYIIKKVGLSKLVKDVIKRNQRDFISKRISLQLGDLDEIIYSDTKWVEFILNQIIGNAIKYSKGKDDKIEIYLKKISSAVVLTIKDHGVGIIERDLNRVFEKGFTGENGRKFGKSTGIGLYLCKKLTDKLGLGLQVQSEENVGTEISIIFPKSENISE